MSWEKLSSKRSKRTEMPAISIQKAGRVAWNQATHKALGEPDFVELLVDREAMRLGLRKVDRGIGNFPVRKVGSQSSWGISARGALGTARLSVDAAYRRYAETDNDVVFIDIAELLSDF